MIRLIIISIFIINQLQAEEEKSLRLGIGGSFLSIPEYIGSSKQKQYILPYPYIQYESKDLTIEKNYLVGHLYNHNNFLIDLSVSGTLPVKSDSDSLRNNMKSLDPTLEIGPNFIYKLFYFSDKKSYLSLEIPIRAIFSVDFPKIKHQGYISNINLHSKLYIYDNLKLELSTGPTFATEQYHNYFYEVETEDVTAKRKEYHSTSGYGGWKNTLGLEYEKNNISYGAFMRYYNLEHAEFIDSSLVDTNNALFYGATISFIF